MAGRLRKLLLVILGTVLTAAFVLLIRNLVSDYRSETAKDSAQDLYTGASAEEAETTVQPDFEKLLAANPDTVGWLRCGECIDYPVVQRDNRFYMQHDFYGRYDKNGTLFVNGINTVCPRDSVLLIHGHNMQSGRMFGTLTDYGDEAYSLSHPVSFRTIYDPEELNYTPVCAVSISVDPKAEGYFALYDFVQSGKERTAYLAQLTERSLWHTDTEIADGDRLLVLVTCSYDYSEGRFLLVLKENAAPHAGEQRQMPAALHG